MRIIDNNNRPKDIKPVRTEVTPVEELNEYITEDTMQPQEEATPQEQKEHERRIEICKGCEHYTGSRCKKCGCFMKFKTRLKNAHCPIGKW